MNKFATWLLKQMSDKNWTQSELARESGLTRSTISYYLSPKSKSPDDDALKKIARAFGLPVDYVFEQAGKLAPKPELSPIKRKLAHVAEGLPDSDVETAIALLEQREAYYKKHPEAKPSK